MQVESQRWAVHEDSVHPPAHCEVIAPRFEVNVGGSVLTSEDDQLVEETHRG
jgi:hypothetical protein